MKHPVLIKNESIHSIHPDYFGLFYLITVRIFRVGSGLNPDHKDFSCSFECSSDDLKMPFHKLVANCRLAAFEMLKAGIVDDLGIAEDKILFNPEHETIRDINYASYSDQESFKSPSPR